MKRTMGLGLSLAGILAVAAVLVPAHYDTAQGEIVLDEACGRVGCVQKPGMECWVLPDQEEPGPGCDMRDCPSSWP